MTLLDLLTAMVFVAPFGGSFAEVKIHHGSSVNYLVAFIVGFVFAMLFGWMDWEKNRLFAKLPELKGPKAFFYIAVPVLSIVLLLTGDFAAASTAAKLMTFLSRT